MSYKAAVLTVSDSAAKDAALDTTGPWIASSLKSHEARLFSDVRSLIVPDKIGLIDKQVNAWIQDEQIDLIITTGGTGWSEKDVTVQALSPLVDKRLTGLEHALTSYGLSKTPLAAISNPFAGIASHAGRRTLIVALPGSKGGVKDGMAVLAPILKHSLSVLGNHVQSEQVMEEVHGSRKEVTPMIDSLPMASTSAQPDSTYPSSSHSHDHHHHHHHHGHHHKHPKPNSAVSSRQRQSPHDMVPLDQAIKSIHDVIGSQGLGVETHPINATLPGHILAEDISSPHPLPLWHSTNVDGYAVMTSDGKGDYDLRPRGSGLPLQPNQIERVNTGGPIPDGADAVVMVEDTELLSSSSTGEELRIRILAPARKGENVRKPGSDMAQGEVVMKSGDLVGFGGGEIGVLSGVGRREVRVHRKPKIAILSTGSELIDLSAIASTPSTTTKSPSEPSWSGIYDSNRPSLKILIESMGWEVIDLGVVRDETGAHEAAMRRGMMEADVVISTGGTSMGEADLIKPLLEHTFNAKIHFGRVAMAPGKPTTFATVPWPSSSSSSSSPGGTAKRDKVFFALPGNPASALVTFYVFVVPALRGLGAYPSNQRELTKIWIELAHSLPISSRPTYHRCTLAFSPSGLPIATSTGGQRSSRVGSLKGAQVLVLVEAGEDGTMAAKGEKKQGLLLPGGWGA